MPGVFVARSEVVVELDDTGAIENRLQDRELQGNMKAECMRTLAITAKRMGPKITFRSGRGAAAVAMV